MAEGAMSLKGMRAQMAAAAQAQAEERRSLTSSSPGLAAPSGGGTKTGAKPVLDGATLRIDDKLRVAKERREEQEKQQECSSCPCLTALVCLAVLLLQEHYEAVMRRTLERSQRLEQRQKRWSWGGGPTAESENKAGDPETAPAVDLVPSSPADPQRAEEADKRSTSTTNLKQADCVISKRLSSSSATLMNSPEKTRRTLAGPLDSGVISRLLTPTQASLARSKSTAALSADGADPPESHLCPRSASASPLHPPRGPLRSRSIDRQKAGPPSSASSEGGADGAQVSPERHARAWRRVPRRPACVIVLRPEERRKEIDALRQSPRNRPSSPGGGKQRPPSPQPSATKPPPIQRPALTPTGPPTLRKRDSKPKEGPTVQPVTPQSPEAPASVAPSTKTKEDSSTKAIAGTTSAEEAAKILAENRRLAREQKEREEQQRLQREEEERLRREEERQLAEQERARREEEEKRLAEEKKREEEENARLAEEERARQELEEQERQAELQQQREEAEARAQEEAEKARQERERKLQQDQQERMERKKRIEEIMKRTRKTDQNDSKRDEKDVQDENGLEMLGAEDETKEGERSVSEDCAEGDPDQSHLGRERSEHAESTAGDQAAITPGEVEELEGVNGRAEEDDQENNNGTCPEGVSLVPEAQPVDSSFVHVNEDSKVGLLPNLNGKSSSWSFEELIDLGVHSKTTLITVDAINADDCNQNLIDAAGIPDGPRVAFEDKAAVTSLSKPIEAVSDM
nr:PREDICTED: ensconsin-like [Lepisosteus oculatus]